MHEHHEDYLASTPNASPANDDAIVERLLMTAQSLIDEDGLLPYQVESCLFTGLTTPAGPELPARRAAVFRAAIGLSAPLARDEASRLAAATGRALRGDPDRDFERRMMLAHARGRWAQAAHDCAETLRGDGVEITPASLEIGLMMSISQSRRGCDLLLDKLPYCSIQTRIRIAVSDFFRGGSGDGGQPV